MKSNMNLFDSFLSVFKIDVNFLLEKFTHESLLSIKSFINNIFFYRII